MAGRFSRGGRYDGAMLSIGLTSTVLLLGTAESAAIPALTEAQVIQLDTAADGLRPDEPAWTGLLSSVATWDPAEAVRGFVPGAAVPDYGKLLAEPGAYRGALLVIEGRYAGRQRETRTQRAGPWGESLKEWGVVVRPEPDESGDESGDEFVAVVYLVDPEGRITPPREGQTVRVLSRFYKTWTDVDADGVPRIYPVFVGRSATVVESAGSTGRGSIVVVGGVVVMAGLLGLVMLARKRRAGRPSKRERVLERLRGAADEEGEETVSRSVNRELPDDPAAALAQLERSRDHV